MALRLSLEEQKNLAKSACKGDKQAEDKIYAAYYKALFGYIRARSTQDADAENISQEVWEQIFVKKAICRYDPSRGTLYTFLWRIAHSRLIDYYRKYKRLYWVQIIENEVSDGENKDYPDFVDTTTIAGFRIDSTEELSSAYKIALENLFRNGGYPHQVIVFAFSKLVDHWKPQKIIDELSSLSLRQLCHKLYEDYILESNLPDEEIISCFTFVKQKMDLLVGEVITDSVLRDKLKPHLNKLVGETNLKDYYGKDLSHSISDWCDKVRKRLARGREETIT